MEGPESFRRVLDALSKLADGAAKELTPEDLEHNLVVKILDEVEVDVSRRAWVVTCDEAIAGAKELVIDGICIPYLGLKDCSAVSRLIATRIAPIFRCCWSS